MQENYPFKEVYAFGDQPATCTICGNRTETLQEKDFPVKVQEHECLTSDCSYRFIMEHNNNNNTE